VFDVHVFVHELRQRVPAVQVVPVYIGPDDLEPGQRNGKERSQVWIAFDTPIDPELPSTEIRDKIDQLGARTVHWKSLI
jgi:hypothetical protein